MPKSEKRAPSDQKVKGDRKGKATHNALSAALPDDPGMYPVPTGYDAEGNFVRWAPDPDCEDACPVTIRRANKAILEAQEELFEKIWWNRHQAMLAGLEYLGQALTPEEAEDLAKAERRARRIERKYGRENLMVSDYELDLLYGRLSALNWVLGSEWEDSPEEEDYIELSCPAQEAVANLPYYL
jgi:hypothetical protein